MARPAKPHEYTLLTRDDDGVEYFIDGGREHELIIKPADRPEDELLNFPAFAFATKTKLGTVAARQNTSLDIGWRAYGWKLLPEEWHPIPHPLGFKREQRFIRRRFADLVNSTPATAPEGRYFRKGKWRLTLAAAAKLMGMGASDFGEWADANRLGSVRVPSPESGQPVREFIESRVVDEKARLVALLAESESSDDEPEEWTGIPNDVTPGWMTWHHLRREVPSVDREQIYDELLEDPRLVNRVDEALVSVARLRRFVLAERFRKALGQERARLSEGRVWKRTERKGRAIYYEPNWARQLLAKVVSGEMEIDDAGPPTRGRFSVPARNAYFLSLFEAVGTPFFENIGAIRDHWNKIAPLVPPSQPKQRIGKDRDGYQTVATGLRRARAARASAQKSQE